jgi:trimeric autotransporter adhesin
MFADSFSNNTIGDTDPSDGSLTNAANVIAFNWGRGVTLGYGAGNGNRILSNSIFENGLLGIDFLRQLDPASGVTPNDPTDPDTGPNRLQTYPDITSAQSLGSFTSINGTLNSTPSRKVRRHHRTRIIRQTFIIQFFRSTSADTSGFGEGETYLGQIEVKTDRQGNASPSPFRFGVNGDLSGQYITATATNKI